MNEDRITGFKMWLYFAEGKREKLDNKYFVTQSGIAIKWTENGKKLRVGREDAETLFSRSE